LRRPPLDLVVAIGLQLLYSIAHLALTSLGLAIIFGMMRVINLAPGEFLMPGGDACAGPPGGGDHRGSGGTAADPLAVRPDGGHVAGPLGLSLLLIGIETPVFGASAASTIAPPLGMVRIGDYSASGL